MKQQKRKGKKRPRNQAARVKPTKQGRALLKRKLHEFYQAQKRRILLAGCLLLALLLFAAMNLLIDPFGVFGDPLFHWDSYSFSQNALLAKVPWIEEHFDEFDSYVVGPSSAGSLPREDLEACFGGSFYNMMAEGADWSDLESLCNFLLDRDEVRTLVIDADLSAAQSHARKGSSLRQAAHPDLDGSSRLLFRLRFLFALPHHALNKLLSRMRDSYLPQRFDAYDAASGAWDTCARDSEPIGNLADYLAAYPDFTDAAREARRLPAADVAAAALGRVRERCEREGVRLVVICPPTYAEAVDLYAPEELYAYFQGLSKATEYWDFTLTSVSFDPRYFYYDETIRNDVGRMLLSRIAGDGRAWCPEDFGALVRADSFEEHWAQFYTAEAGEVSEGLTVLRYRDLTAREGDSDMDEAMTVHQFAQEMVYLQENGYHTVTLEELRAFVEQGTPLPEHPVLVTLDGGYLSHYVYAYPILEELGQHAVLFVDSAELERTTQDEAAPRLSAEQAKELVASGSVSVQRGLSDSHASASSENGGRGRKTTLRPEGMSERNYIAMLRADWQAGSELLEAATGERQLALAFPGEELDTLTHAILREEGVAFTVSDRAGAVELVKGLRQSLFAIARNDVARGLSLDEFAALLGE